MTIAVIGTGFVGVVSSAVYASLGHTVIGLDVDDKKIALLKQFKVPFFEPQLEELLEKQQAAGNLSFTSSYQEAISDADLILICVGTPSSADGQADLKYVKSAAESLAQHLKENAVVAIKSTVPPGTLDTVESIIQENSQVAFHTASLPEFLREGSAVHDTLNPDRIVIGTTTEHARKLLTSLHQPFNAPLIHVKPNSAQMGKYSANAYLATRITFINQIADLCEKNGADIDEVIAIIGKDKRIGDHYWYPGFGYGGSCFPKDVNELAAYSRSIGEQDNLLVKMTEINSARIPKLLKKYESTIGTWKDKKIALLGLSFKPNTNDIREAPSTKVIPVLLEAGAHIIGFDPEAIEVTQEVYSGSQIEYVSSIDAAVKDADIIMALVEWKQIVSFDFATSKSDKEQWFIDARNQFNKTELESAGYHYIGVGK